MLTRRLHLKRGLPLGRPLALVSDGLLLVYLIRLMRRTPALGC
jgi:hypothetical protein